MPKQKRRQLAQAQRPRRSAPTRVELPLLRGQPRYLVLAITSANGSSEDAVAISPLAGRHATYVVRRECAEADWTILFACPNFEARLRGAWKLLFTTTDRGVDQYSAMRDKVVNLLECDPREFRKGTVQRTV